MARLTIIDFETYYDSAYSLKSMTPLAYILDDRFQVHGAAVKEGPPFGEAEWVERDGLPSLFARLAEECPWSDRVLVCHNAHFDGAILAWRYGIVPGLYVDTVSMARAIVKPVYGSASLDAVARYLGKEGAKDRSVVQAAAGKTLDELKSQPSEYEKFKAYACMDAELCFQAYERFRKLFPVDELYAIDLAARMAILPQVGLNVEVVREVLEKVRAIQGNLLSALHEALPSELIAGQDLKSILMSSDKLAQVLEALGVTVPMKLGTSGELIPAFAKSDPEFAVLLEHEDPLVQAIAAARVNVRSTHEESRAKRLMAAASVKWTDEARQVVPALRAGVETPMPMPLHYYGAKTGRFSGGWKWNVQNFGRKSLLRKAIVAPPGHKIVACDEAQVEARLTAALAGQYDLVGDFISGQDVYSQFASFLFGRPINKDTDPVERFLGKTAILGLGYGMGARRFVYTCWALNKIRIPLAEAERIVDLYRAKYRRIAGLWYTFSDILSVAEGLRRGGDPQRQTRRLDLGVSVTFSRLAFETSSSEGRVDTFINLPNGMSIPYLDVRVEVRETEHGPRAVYTVQDGPGRRIVNGTLMTENTIQALARIVVMEAAVNLQREGFPWRPFLQVHDELLYVVPEQVAESAALTVSHVMSRDPLWLPRVYTGLLKAEAKIGDNMLEAK